MAQVFIGIGSNQGERRQFITKALRALRMAPGVRVLRVAAIIETDPVGPPQERYLNTAAELATSLEPGELLGVLQEIERRLGRTPSPRRWGPRVIDLDILLYDDRIVREPRLRIPHPRLHERTFALDPLVELAPQRLHPELRQPLAVLRDRLTARS